MSAFAEKRNKLAVHGFSEEKVQTASQKIRTKYKSLDQFLHWHYVRYLRVASFSVSYWAEVTPLKFINFIIASIPVVPVKYLVIRKAASGKAEKIFSER